jgi:hypothetical protein
MGHGIPQELAVLGTVVVVFIICQNWFKIQWIWMKLGQPQTKKMMPDVTVMAPRAGMPKNYGVSICPTNDKSDKRYEAKHIMIRHDMKGNAS